MVARNTPSMSISRQDIEKVALLARLRLSEAELATMTNELAQIVGYVDQLAEVDTNGVEPMAHAIEVANVFRADVVTASLPRNEALANAPNRDERGYLVPAVLGD
jgi:aspartyl-tRNA(Asn)/glutamyl-tRNA(Gln) amidotransferase subunit C